MNELTQSFDDPFRDITVSSELASAADGESGIGQLSTISTVTSLADRDGIDPLVDPHRGMAMLDPSRLLGGFAFRIIDRYGTADLTFRDERPPDRAGSEQPDQPEQSRDLAEKQQSTESEGQGLNYLDGVDPEAGPGDGWEFLDETAGEASVRGRSVDASEGVEKGATPQFLPSDAGQAERQESGSAGRTAALSAGTSQRGPAKTENTAGESGSVAVPWRPRTSSTDRRLVTRTLDTGEVTSETVPERTTRGAGPSLRVRETTRTTEQAGSATELEDDATERGDAGHSWIETAAQGRQSETTRHTDTDAGVARSETVSWTKGSEPVARSDSGSRQTSRHRSTGDSDHGTATGHRRESARPEITRQSTAATRTAGQSGESGQYRQRQRDRNRRPESGSAGHSPITSTRERHRDHRTVSTVLADRSPAAEPTGTGTAGPTTTSRANQSESVASASSVLSSEEGTESTRNGRAGVTESESPNAAGSSRTTTAVNTHEGAEAGATPTSAVEPEIDAGATPTSAVEPEIGVQSPGVLELAAGSERGSSATVRQPSSGHADSGGRPALTHRQSQDTESYDAAEPTAERTAATAPHPTGTGRQSTSFIDRRGGWDPTGRVSTGRSSTEVSPTSRAAVTGSPAVARDDWTGSGPQPTVSTQTASSLSASTPRADQSSADRAATAGARTASESSQSGAVGETASISTESGGALDRTTPTGAPETGQSLAPDGPAGAPSPDDPAGTTSPIDTASGTSPDDPGGAATPDDPGGAATPDDPTRTAATPTSRRSPVEPGAHPETGRDPAVEKTTTAVTSGQTAPAVTSGDRTAATGGKSTPSTTSRAATAGRGITVSPTTPSKIGPTASDLAVTRWTGGTEIRDPVTGDERQQAVATPVGSGGAEAARMIPQQGTGRADQQTPESQAERAVERQPTPRLTAQAAGRQSSGAESPTPGWIQPDTAETGGTGGMKRTSDSAGGRTSRLPSTTVSTPTLATIHSDEITTASGRRWLDRPAPEPDRRTISESREAVASANRSPSSERESTVGVTGRGSMVEGQPVDSGQESVQLSSDTERLPTTPVQRMRSDDPSIHPTTGSWATDTLRSSDPGGGQRLILNRTVASGQPRQIVDRSGNSASAGQETPTTASQGSADPQSQPLLGDQRTTAPTGQDQSRLDGHSPTLTYQSETVLDSRPVPERQDQSALDGQRTERQDSGRQLILGNRSQQPTEGGGSVLDDTRTARSGGQDGSVIGSQQPAPSSQGSSALGSERAQAKTTRGQSRIETLTLQRTPKESVRSSGRQSVSASPGQQGARNAQIDSQQGASQQPSTARSLPPTASTPDSVSRRQQPLTNSASTSKAGGRTDATAARPARTTIRTPGGQPTQSPAGDSGRPQESVENGGQRILADHTASDGEQRGGTSNGTGLSDERSPGTPAQTERRPVPDRQRAGSSRTVTPPTTVTPSVLDGGRQAALGQRGREQHSISQSGEQLDSDGQASGAGRATRDRPAAPGDTPAPTTLATSSDGTDRASGGKKDSNQNSQQPTTALGKRGSGPATRVRTDDVSNKLSNIIQSRADMTNQMDKYLTRKREAATDQAMSGAVTDRTTARGGSDPDEPSFVYRSPIPTGQTDQRAESTEDTTQRHIDRSTGQSGTDAVDDPGVNRSTDIRDAGERFVTDRASQSERQTSRNAGREKQRTDKQSRQQRRTEDVRPADELETQRSSPSLPDQPSTSQHTPSHTSDRSTRDSHSARRSRDHRDTEIGVPDKSLEYEADVDRVVERLHRKLERRKRIERERKGER